MGGSAGLNSSWLASLPARQKGSEMTETKTDELLAALLNDFSRLRSTARLNRRDVIKALDQAETCIIALLCYTSEAEGVTGMLQDQIDRVAAANRKLAQLAACFTGGGRYGTA